MTSTTKFREAVLGDLEVSPISAARLSPGPEIEGEVVKLIWPKSLDKLVEEFGARFFIFDPQQRRYVGNPAVAPAICRIIGGSEAEGARLLQRAEDAYAEYVEVQRTQGGGFKGFP